MECAAVAGMQRREETAEGRRSVVWEKNILLRNVLGGQVRLETLNVRCAACLIRMCGDLRVRATRMVWYAALNPTL